MEILKEGEQIPDNFTHLWDMRQNKGIDSPNLGIKND